MAGVEILALYVAISFFFIILGYASKNKVFAFAGGSVILVLSLILIVFGYDVQTGSNLVTSFNYTDNLTSATNTTETRVFTPVKDNYTYAIGTLLLIMSLFIMLEIGRGVL